MPTAKEITLAGQVRLAQEQIKKLEADLTNLSPKNCRCDSNGMCAFHAHVATHFKQAVVSLTMAAEMLVMAE